MGQKDLRAQKSCPDFRQMFAAKRLAQQHCDLPGPLKGGVGVGVGLPGWPVYLNCSIPDTSRNPVSENKVERN